jgi:hypothetical protein
LAFLAFDLNTYMSLNSVADIYKLLENYIQIRCPFNCSC